MIKKTVTQVIDNEYLSYAMYTLESRAIPSVIDGMKPVLRKLLYAMINEYGGKKTKLADLGSISKYNYHHGEASAQAAAVGMAADWSNNAPIFTGYGNFGSRLIQEAAAPRYIYAALSENYKKYFSDEEVCPKSNDPENPEPAHYLPIIPWILVNGIQGISVGFKTDILPRSTKDIVKSVKAYLKSPQTFLDANKPIPPTFPRFSGNVIQISQNQWKTQGQIAYIGKNYFEITELPVGYDRESYVNVLNDLVDKDLIKDYDDNCSKSGFGFKVKVSLAQKDVIEKDPLKYFKLEKTHTEILTTMGIDGKLKIFDSVAQLIGYFCDYRLLKFEHKITYDINKLSEEMVRKTHKKQFLQAVVSGKINLAKSTKENLLEYISKNVTDADYGKSFIRIPLYECTAEAIDILDASIESDTTYLKSLKSETPMTRFSACLSNL